MKRRGKPRFRAQRRFVQPGEATAPAPPARLLSAAVQGTDFNARRWTESPGPHRPSKPGRPADRRASAVQPAWSTLLALWSKREKTKPGCLRSFVRGDRVVLGPGCPSGGMAAAAGRSWTSAGCRRQRRCWHGEHAEDRDRWRAADASARRCWFYHARLRSSVRPPGPTCRPTRSHRR